MKQIIICISCSTQSGCVVNGSERLCSRCKNVPDCSLLDCSEITTEKFFTCKNCSERASRHGDYD